MANTIATLHVDTPNSHILLDELRAFISHLASLGHHVEQAQVVHGAGTPQQDTEHLVGGPGGAAAAPDALASPEPGGAESAGGEPAATSTTATA